MPPIKMKVSPEATLNSKGEIEDYSLDQGGTVLCQQAGKHKAPQDMFGIIEEPYQQDRLATAELSSDVEKLSLNQLVQRIWTANKCVGSKVNKGLGNPPIKPEKIGATGSSVVFAQNHLITSTVGDASSFAAIYDKQGHCRGVVRLNSKSHNLTHNTEEEARSVAAGGSVEEWFGSKRLNLNLEVSRSFGDTTAKQKGSIDDPQMDVISLEELAKQSNVSTEEIGEIKCFTGSDGLTDGASSATKESHEAFMKEILDSLQPNTSNADIANHLVTQAIAKVKKADNTSLALHSIQIAYDPETKAITSKTKPFIITVADGHGDKSESLAAEVASGLVYEVSHQCGLTESKYKGQEFSVKNKSSDYYRDNVDYASDIVASLKEATAQYESELSGSKKNEGVRSILDQLQATLNDTQKNDQEKVIKYYQILDQQSASQTENNMKIIENNTHPSTTTFLKRIAAIASLVIGLIPGLIALPVIAALKNKRPMDLIRSSEETFKTRLLETKSKYNETNADKIPDVPAPSKHQPQ